MEESAISTLLSSRHVACGRQAGLSTGRGAEVECQGPSSGGVCTPQSVRAGESAYHEGGGPLHPGMLATAASDNEGRQLTGAIRPRRQSCHHWRWSVFPDRAAARFAPRGFVLARSERRHDPVRRSAPGIWSAGDLSRPIYSLCAPGFRSPGGSLPRMRPQQEGGACKAKVLPQSKRLRVTGVVSASGRSGFVPELIWIQ